MKSIKRSLNDRFYNRGYRAGIGESQRKCAPLFQVPHAWLSGGVTVERILGWPNRRIGNSL